MIAVEGACVSFGGVRALDDVSLACAGGAIVGVVGPNGSGKSSLFDAISGRIALDAGTISVNGSRIDGLQPHRVALLGLARTYEADHLFGRMTAFENVLAGTVAREGSDATRATEAAAVLESLSLADRARAHVWDLSPGERRRVAIGRALAARAASLLVEEPFMSLDDGERDIVRTVLRAAAKERGSAVVLSARDVEACAGLCDDVLVLHAGKSVARGPFEAVVRDIDVRDAYLGVEWRQ